jgi:hypothetical protein
MMVGGLSEIALSRSHRGIFCPPVVFWGRGVVSGLLLEADKRMEDGTTGSRLIRLSA